MKLLGWNCQGLGGPRADRALKEVLKSSQPQILGLIETKLRNCRWDLLRSQLGFRCCFAVEREGMSGGLALLWKKDSCVDIQSYSKHHLDAIIRGRCLSELRCSMETQR
ncbi:hypothetical protein QQ045_030841 [Rhodiola kirilowii]